MPRSDLEIRESDLAVVVEVDCERDSIYATFQQCPMCDYSFQGFGAEGACPECGWAFDEETCVFLSPIKRFLTRVMPIFSLGLNVFVAVYLLARNRPGITMWFLQYFFTVVVILGVTVQTMVLIHRYRISGSWSKALDQTDRRIVGPKGVLHISSDPYIGARHYDWADYDWSWVTDRSRKKVVTLRRREDHKNAPATNSKAARWQFRSAEDLHHFIVLAKKYIQIEDEKRHGKS